MRHAPIEITRARLEAKIEELIALLDMVDGDCDLEDNNDAEPSLGTHGMAGRDRVEDDLEWDSSDDELSMGWNNPRFGESPLPNGWSMGDYEQ